MTTITFFGSDQYSAVALSAILDQPGITVSAVVTDRGKAEPNPIEKLANERKIKVIYYPENIDKSNNSSTGLIASFGHILPASLINVFPHGILNIHPSLLPQYRGVSPVPYAIAMGDSETAVTVFKIDTGIDNGQILAQQTAAIPPNITSPELLTQLFQVGARLATSVIANNFQPLPLPTPPNFGALRYAKKFSRDSGFIEWPAVQKLINQSPIQPGDTQNYLLTLRLAHNPQGSILHDLVRALTPWPGVWTKVPTQKGELRVTITSVLPQITVKLAGKPKPITYSDFEKYYL